MTSAPMLEVDLLLPDDPDAFGTVGTMTDYEFLTVPGSPGATGVVDMTDGGDGTTTIDTLVDSVRVLQSSKAIALGHGEVSVADPSFGTWPPASNDISNALDAAIAAAQAQSRVGAVVIPAGPWTISRQPNWGTSAPTIMLRSVGRGPAQVISTDSSVVLVNVKQRITRLELRDLTLSGMGAVRLADTSAASITDASRTIDRLTGVDVPGTWISSANSDQANWYIRTRAVARDASSDPGVLAGTLGIAINGLMDGADIVASLSKFRLGSKFGHSGQNSRIVIYNVYAQDASRTWWSGAIWLVPEQNGPGNTDGRGPGHPGGSFKSCKMGNEEYLSATDYRFMSFDPVGTIPVPGSLSPLLVGVKPSTTVPVAGSTGWTVDVQHPDGTHFVLVAKFNGTTMETSPSFANMAAAQTWSQTTPATYLDVWDQANGTSADGVIPAVASGIAIADWGTAMPLLSASSQGWVIGVDIDDCRVTGIGAGVNPPLWTLATSPDHMIGCAIRGTKLLDTAGSAQDPNWPTYMAKFVGDTTAVTAGFPLNRIEGTATTTRRKAAATPNAPMIPPSNVAGVFQVAGDQPAHFGVPTGAASSGTHWGTGGSPSFTSVTGNDRRHVVKWTTGTGTTTGVHVDITFATAHARAPQVQISMGSNNAAVYVTNITTTGYTLGLIGTADSKNIVVNVLVEQSP